jgi:hypothetical protein
MEPVVEYEVADIFKSSAKPPPRRNRSPALSRSRAPSRYPPINRPQPLRSLQHTSFSPQNHAKTTRGTRGGLLLQVRPPDPPRVPRSIHSGPGLPTSQNLPGTLFSTSSANPHLNLTIGTLSGEIRRHPTPPSAGVEAAVDVVPPVARVHHTSTRKSLPNTTVPFPLAISPWIVADDRRKLSVAGALFRFLNLTCGPHASASLCSARTGFRRRIQPEYAFSFGLRIRAEPFSV